MKKTQKLDFFFFFFNDGSRFDIFSIDLSCLVEFHKLHMETFNHSKPQKVTWPGLLADVFELN